MLLSFLTIAALHLTSLELVVAHSISLHPVPPVSLIYQPAPFFKLPAKAQPATTHPASTPTFISPFKSHGVTTTYQVLGVYPSTRVVTRLQQCEIDVFRAYLALPASQRRQLARLTLQWKSDQQRGLGGGSSLTLKCNDLSPMELTSVFVHEMGHIIDTGLMEGHSSAGVSNFKDYRLAIFKDDPSLGFYSISWKNTTTRWKHSSTLDFVTEYASSDPFEDFAESYNFYLLHGSQFKYAAQFNTRLMQKYIYMRDHMFGGREFVNNHIKLDATKRAYDATVLPFSLANFTKSH